MVLISRLPERTMKTLTQLVPKPIKQKFKDILVKQPFIILGQRYAGAGVCLMYHSITDKKPVANQLNPILDIGVHKENFEEQIQYVAKNYNCIDLPTAVELLKKNRLPKKSVVITLDDGYKDNLTIALPILKKYNVPATIYITTGLIDRMSTFWWFEQSDIINKNSEISFVFNNNNYYFNLKTFEKKLATYAELNQLFKTLDLQQQNDLMQQLRKDNSTKYDYSEHILTWPEVIELSKENLITIGAHTINHPVLSRLNESQTKDEIILSRKLIENKIQASVEHFSYPYGGINEAGDREYNMARESNFASAVTTTCGYLQNNNANSLYALPRIGVNFTDNMNDFKFKLSGFLSMF